MNLMKAGMVMWSYGLFGTSLGGMDLMKADMVMASGRGCMYWMNLMEAGMVMIVIRTGVGEVNVGLVLVLQNAKLARMYCS